MAFRNMPLKNWRLKDGTMGTEYDFLLQTIKRKEAERQHLDDEIEALRRRLDVADGHP